VARVVAFVPDLLFGSSVMGALQAGGHDPVLVSAPDQLEGALAGADVLIVDLTHDVDVRIAATRDADVKTLAFFSHVEVDVKALATTAGFDLVVPRSRMARATALLVDELLAA
jgi:hypothetical protein